MRGGLTAFQKVAAGLPHQHAKPDQGDAAQQVHERALHQSHAVRQIRIERVEDDMLAAQGDQGQGPENDDDHHQLGQFQ